MRMRNTRTRMKAHKRSDALECECDSDTLPALKRRCRIAHSPLWWRLLKHLYSQSKFLLTKKYSKPKGRDRMARQTKKAQEHTRKCLFYAIKFERTKQNLNCLWGNIQRSFLELFFPHRKKKVLLCCVFFLLLFRLVSFCSLNRKTLSSSSCLLCSLVIISIFRA